LTVQSAIVDHAAARLAQAGIDSPLLEAQLLMAHALGCSRLDVIAHPDRALTEDESGAFEAMLRRRLAREPLAYILGRREFYGIEIDVPPGVLVPRPETELLVEQAKHFIEKRLDRLGVVSQDNPQNARALIADIGTGSGAVAIALAVAVPFAVVYATDCSPAAVRAARSNVEKHGLTGRATCLQGDLLQPLAGLSFDVIVSNPPYVPSAKIADLQPEIRLYEPLEALDGGEDGLAIYRRLIPEAGTYLRKDGFLAVEVGLGQAEAVCGIARAAGYKLVETARDLAGIERVVVAHK